MTDLDTEISMRQQECSVLRISSSPKKLSWVSSDHRSSYFGFSLGTTKFPTDYGRGHEENDGKLLREHS